MSVQLGKFVLVNQEGPGSFVFDFFPAKINTTQRANWEAQDVTIGTKPIFYGNRDPRRITVDEIWLDGTDSGSSITEDIKLLFALQKETKQGTPPALAAIWGDRQEQVVLEEVSIEEQFFSSDGEPLRARVRLQLIEIQSYGEQTSNADRDDVDFSDEIKFRGIGPQL